MKEYLVVVECAIEYNGKFLIIKRPIGKHGGGLLAFPGGRVEEQDELHKWDILRSAIKREVFEEVGLVIEDPLNYITTAYFIDSNSIHTVDSIFHCVLNKTNPQVKVSEREVASYYWMSVDEINRAKDTPDWLKQYITLINK